MRFFPRISSSRLALGKYITLCLFLGFDKVDALIVRLHLLIDHLGDFLVLADESGRSAKVVPCRHPKEVKEQQMVFPRSKPHAASDHLLIKGADFGRTQDHDAVYGRAIPAFGEQHGIARHVISACLEIVKHLRTVIVVTVYLCGADFCEVAMSGRNTTVFLPWQ